MTTTPALLSSDDGLTIANPAWRTIPRLTHGVTTCMALPYPGKQPLAKGVRQARANGAIPNWFTVGADQVHGDEIVVLNEPLGQSTRPEGLEIDLDARVAEFAAADALVTNQFDLLLLIQTADCLPIFAIDPERETIGMAHCGWRGLYAGLAGKLIGTMLHEGANRRALQAWLGPCIRVESYEVGEELVNRFSRRFPKAAVSPNGTHLNLAAVAHRQLLDAGVADSKIFDCGECTFGMAERYHSYRRDAADSGRMYSFMGLRRH